MTMDENYNIAKSLGATICLSGAFDIIHIGHIRLFKAAEYFGNVVVILNSDPWVKKHRGMLVMSWEQRREILLGIKLISDVIPVDDTDGTVCSALKKYRPTVFGNGGNRTKWTTPERDLCLKNNIKLVYGLGGGESKQISLNLREKIKNIGCE